MMMAHLIRALGRYENECKNIALPRYPTAGTLEKYAKCHQGPEHNGVGYEERHPTQKAAPVLCVKVKY
jgi:hypothetical protein